jgi:hypothetical protein
MTTALDLITQALQSAGILYKSETPDADESSDALDELNNMLDEWSNDSLMIVSRVRESFPSTGAVSYTIGSGGDFDTIRPLNIRSVFARIGSTDYPMGEISDENYSLIQTKATPGTPDFYNYNNAFPLGLLTFYPYPTSAYEIHIYSDKAITNIASLTTDISLPPGWKSAIRYNLAARMAPLFGQPLSPELAGQALSSLAAIKRTVSKERGKNAYPQMINNSNIYTGWNQ